eukprot:3436250-Amphidinium_carterae.1
MIECRKGRTFADPILDTVPDVHMFGSERFVQTERCYKPTLQEIMCFHGQLKRKVVSNADWRHECPKVRKKMSFTGRSSG